MKSWLLDHLRCPFCAASIAADLALETERDELLYGVLECTGCRESFAVVEGIPLLAPSNARMDVRDETTDEVVIGGACLAQVITAIRQQRAIQALALLLNPTSLDAGSWSFDPSRGPDRPAAAAPASEPAHGASDDPADLRSISGILKDGLRGPYRRMRAAYRRLRLSAWREELARFLRDRRPQRVAADLLGMYYGEYSGAEGMASYFMYRFGQPRHLAALSAVSTVRSANGMTLDLACGAGHLTHYLTYGLPDTRAVGIDREFFRLYVAKHFIAPSAEFLCMPADLSIPFDDGLFSGVVCSDALHCFRYKTVAAQEMTRVLMPGGGLVLTRVGNGLQEPREGYELDPDGYRALFAPLSPRMTGEDELMSRYLQGELPDLSRQTPDEQLVQEKWLTIFASSRSDIFVDHGAFPEPPHSIGRLAVNPIFLQQENPDGALDLRFEFPSSWYAFEDAAYRAYTSAQSRMDAKTRLDVERNIRSDDVLGHIARFEVIGTPDRFCRPV